MDIMEGCSKEKSRREGEIIRKGPRRMGPFGPLNSDLQSANDFINNFCHTSNTYSGDLNGLITPGFYNQLINIEAINSPGFYCYLLVFEYANRSFTQIAFGYNETKLAIRYLVNNSSWSSWKVFS